VTKVSGLGDAFFVGGYDLSNDTQSLDTISQPMAMQDVTGLDKKAHERLALLIDGSMSFTTYFNPAAGQQHKVLSVLPRADVQMMYFNNRIIGNPAACQIGKQLDYAPTRAADGSLGTKVAADANGFGLEWGNQLTAGPYTGASVLAGNASTFEGGIANWAAVTNCAVAQSAAQSHGGTKSLALTSTAGGDMVAESCAAVNILTQGFAVVPGQQVSVQSWIRTAVSARTVSVGCHWFTSGGVSVSTTYAAGVADASGAWAIDPGTVAAPATAAFYCVSVKVTATGAGAEVHYIDDVLAFALPTSYDTGASLSFGAQAYLQVFAFTGTDATVSIQDSADNVTFAAMASPMSFAATSAANTVQRIAIPVTATVRRYVEVVVSTVAGFTALSFACAIVKNQTLTQGVL
jgi:hypothetical protein